MSELRNEREQAIHLRRAGMTTAEVAASLSRSEQWVRKWWRLYQADGWSALVGKSQAPHQHGTRTSDALCQQILAMRSQLEAEAVRGKGLKHRGARAIRSRLQRQGKREVPSVSTIERMLRQAGMTRQPNEEEQPQVVYPHLGPEQPHELCQVDIVPHWLGPGEAVACFNAIDVVSRYPSGQAYAHRRSSDAAHFLLHVWQTLGIPRYTQVDNEGCFSGGATHPHVLGKVVRLALRVGTELVFSPVYHPQSNGWVERFHQEYNRHVWQDTQLADRDDVQAHTDHFLANYRHCDYLRELDGQTPDALHHRDRPDLLDATFTLPDQRQPLTEGKVHFMRAVQPDSTVRVLNADWSVPNVEPQTGVWVTLEFTRDGATFTVYDQAPDGADRRCLVTHDFPLKEVVLARSSAQDAATARSLSAEQSAEHSEPETLPDDVTPDPLSSWIHFSSTLLAIGLELARFARSPSDYFR